MARRWKFARKAALFLPKFAVRNVRTCMCTCASSRVIGRTVTAARLRNGAAMSHRSQADGKAQATEKSERDATRRSIGESVWGEVCHVMELKSTLALCRSLIMEEEEESASPVLRCFPLLLPFQIGPPFLPLFAVQETGAVILRWHEFRGFDLTAGGAVSQPLRTIKIFFSKGPKLCTVWRRRCFDKTRGSSVGMRRLEGASVVEMTKSSEDS